MTRPALLLLLALSLAAQAACHAADVTPLTRLLLGKPTMSTRIAPSHHTAYAEASEPSPYVPLILLIDGDDTINSLYEMGVVIYHTRDNMLLTSIPRDVIDSVLALPGVLHASASGDMSSVLDCARVMTRVDDIDGYFTGSGATFDGSGVVVGFSDIGFDPGHIAFHGHIAGIVDYDSETASRHEALTPDDIAMRAYDAPDEYHATHVAGILAGSYRDNNMQGVATGSRIFATTSKLHDVGILSGVEDIIGHARSMGQRTVINLSLSNHLGPHDGTDLMCRYLSALAEDAVICISAGNSGHRNCHAALTLTDATPTARVVHSDIHTWTGFNQLGYADIWAEDDTPLSVTIAVYDNDNRQIVLRLPALEPNPDNVAILTIDPMSHPDWGIYFNGTVSVASSLSTLNNRFNATVEFNATTAIMSARGAWARYNIVVEVTRHDECRKTVNVDLYSDTVYSVFSGMNDDETRIDADGSINNMCTAPGVIAVGACNSRNTAPLLEGGESTWNFDVDNVARFSSYSSTAVTSTPLPHFCAPGNFVVSALSTPFNDNHPGEVAASSKSIVDGHEYYWTAQCGTSMSSPFTAGVFALWLQADPTLTPQKLIDTAQATASTSYTDIHNPRWGAGCIDALAGLRHVVSHSSVTSPYAAIRPLVEVIDRRIRVTVPESTYPFDIRLCDISGRHVDPTSSLQPGIYIITVNHSFSQKVTVL